MIARCQAAPAHPGLGMVGQKRIVPYAPWRHEYPRGAVRIACGPQRVTRQCCPGDDCWAHDEQDREGQCWGEVTAVDEIYDDEDYYWVHGCTGHGDYSDTYTWPPLAPGMSRCSQEHHP